MKFAEFEAGQTLSAGPYKVTESEILDFAKRFDPQWFHTDPLAAKGGHFRGLIASGWHTCAMAMRLIADSHLVGSESLASPGIDHIRWPSPVRPGDVLRLTATVLETRRSATQPTLGILRWRWQLHNQRQDEVLNLVATSMFRLALLHRTDENRP